MEELNKIYKEFEQLMLKVTRNFKKFNENEKIIIEFYEGRVSGLLNACYMMDDDIPEKLMKVLKNDFIIYKNLAGMEE